MPTFFRRDWKNPQITSVWILRVPAETGISYFPNTCLKRYRLSQRDRLCYIKFIIMPFTYLFCSIISLFRMETKAYTLLSRQYASKGTPVLSYLQMFDLTDYVICISHINRLQWMFRSSHVQTATISTYWVTLLTWQNEIFKPNIEVWRNTDLEVGDLGISL
jgi:hypothetical protein